MEGQLEQQEPTVFCRLESLLGDYCFYLEIILKVRTNFGRDQ